MLPDGDEVAFLQHGDKFAGFAPVTIGIHRDAPDGFGERGHNAKSICCGLTPVSRSSNWHISSCVRGIGRAPHSANSLNRAARAFFPPGSRPLVSKSREAPREADIPPWASSTSCQYQPSFTVQAV